MTSTQPTLRCAYRYDPLDQLINQTQPDMPTLQRFYCKSRLATEIQGATQHSIIQHGDLLLAQQQHLSDALDTTLLVTDLQRSVLQTVKVNHPPQPIAYSPYGHRPIANGLLSLLGFNGERPDPVTGHYLLGNGYRAFNPVLMRFNSPDSWSPFGKGGLNPYTYCLGDPVNRDDKTGHSSLLTSFFRFVESRTIKGIIPNQFLTLNSNTNRESAIKFISTLKTQQPVASSRAHLQRAFKHDYNSAMNPIPIPPSSLKGLAKNKILAHRLPTDSLPTAARIELHPNEYKELMNMLIDKRDISTPKISESNLQTLPAVLTRKDYHFKEIAMSYRSEMLNIRSSELSLIQSDIAHKYFLDAHKIFKGNTFNPN